MEICSSVFLSETRDFEFSTLFQDKIPIVGNASGQQQKTIVYRQFGAY
jgi:hypothetical protein